MKKLTIWQLVTTVLTLSVFFITLNLTGDKETAAAALVALAAAALAAAFLSILAAAFLSVLAAVSAAVSAAAALVALAAAVSAAAALVALATAVAVLAAAVAASELKISKQEAVTRYLLQFMITLAPMLFYVFKT